METFIPALDGYGIYKDNCTAYKIENNAFDGGVGATFGIYTYNSGVQENRIYRNTFSGIPYSSLISQTNGDVSTGKGLFYQCNDYTTSSLVDVGITTGVTRSYWGNCGGPKEPANNQFSRTASFGDIYKNTLVQAFTYVHSKDPSGTFNVVPISYSPNIFPSGCFNLSNFNYSQSCPDQTPPKTKGEIKNNLSLLRIQKNNLVGQIDAGNTQSLLSIIQSNSSPGQIKNTLMAASPYLSDEVLLATINGVASPLPAGILKQILEANAPLSDTVWQAVLNRTPSLPNGHINQLTAIQNSNTTSPMENLLLDISFVQRDIDFGVNDLIRYFLTDSAQLSPLDSIAALLLIDESLQAKCLLAQVYTAKADSSAAQSVIDTLRAENPNLSDFCSLQEKIIQLQTAPRRCFNIVSDTLMPDISAAAANVTHNRECALAQAILENFGGFNYPEIFEPLISARISNTNNQSEPILVKSLHLFNAYPNPYNNSTIIEYQLADNSFEAELIVVEAATGRIAKKYRLEEQEGKINVKQNELNSGIYLYYITTSNGNSKVKKLVKTN